MLASGLDLNTIVPILVGGFLAVAFSSYGVRYVLRRRRSSVAGGLGLSIGTAQDAVHRGEEVEALVSISRLEGLANVEVGIVCTEYFYEEDSWTDSEGRTQTSTKTTEAIAHEAWLPVENIPGVQSARFTVPQETPLSAPGMFKWEVVARARRRRRLDAVARHEISVLL